MFKEIVLGKTLIDYRYAMQLEPDVFPIADNWLLKLRKLTRVNSFG